MVHSNSDWTDCKYEDIAVVENACDPGKWLLKVRCKLCLDDKGCSVADIVDDWFCSETTLSSRVHCALCWSRLLPSRISHLQYPRQSIHRHPDMTCIWPSAIIYRDHKHFRQRQYLHTCSQIDQSSNTPSTIPTRTKIWTITMTIYTQPWSHIWSDMVYTGEKLRTVVPTRVSLLIHVFSVLHPLPRTTIIRARGSFQRYTQVLTAQPTSLWYRVFNQIRFLSMTLCRLQHKWCLLHHRNCLRSRQL